MANPITVAQNAILTFIKSEPAFAALVTAANVKSFAGNIDERQDVVVEQDLPDILVLPSTLTPSLSYTSNAVKLLQVYSIELNSGQWDVEVFDALNFATICACCHLIFSDTLKDLQWQSKTFVTDVDFNNLTLGISDSTENRGISGHTTVAELMVTMIFTRSNIIDYSKGLIS